MMIISMMLVEEEEGRGMDDHLKIENDDWHVKRRFFFFGV